MNKSRHYQLNYLTELFYQNYPSKDYPEIENKSNRPYMVLLVKIDENNFAIPFRTNIRHNNCYKFKDSSRPTESVTGLDYSKAVIVNNSSYIGSPARINDREYIELDRNYYAIIKRFKEYVKGYISFVNGTHNPYIAKRYRYTTLQYFHNELGL